MGTRLAPSADLATLPITFQILGLASAAIPASILMSKFGRKAGFLLGTVLGAVSYTHLTLPTNREV